MRLLFDQNLSFRLCKILTDVFPGSIHVSNVGLTAALDSAIWRYAGEKDLTLVSHDSDFAELAVLSGPPPKLVWLRCGNRPTQQIADLLREHSAAIASFLEDDGAFCYQIYG